MRPVVVLIITLSVAFVAVGTTPSNSTVAQTLASLRRLYDATDGPNWRRRCKDPGNAETCWSFESTSTVIGSDSAVYCQWYGVSCLSQTAPEQVTHLALMSNSLCGTIPGDTLDALGGSLLNLNLALNSGLEGDVAFLGALKVAANIDLQSCAFSGPAFEHIGSLPSLKTISLKGNQFTGSLPVGIASRFPVISHLSVSGNQFTGSVPPGLANITSLVSLDISRNLFSGELPVLCSPGSQLASVDVSFNAALTGVGFPGQLSMCGAMVRVWASDCAMSGPFPDGLTFFFLPKLQVLQLANNSYAEPFPEAFNTTALFGSLTVLDLSFNNFSGSPPVTLLELANAGSLLVLNIEGNGLMRARSLPGPGSPWSLDRRTTHAFSTSVECYLVRVAGDLTVRYDESFFDYAQCYCVAGTYGTAPDACVPCPEHAACEGGPAFTWGEGFFPVLHDDTWAVLECEAEEEGETPCVPEAEGDEGGAGEAGAGQVTPVPIPPCSVVAGEGVSHRCELCEPGYTDRLCSRCAEGYFAVGEEGCAECKRVATWLLCVLAGICGAGVVVAALVPESEPVIFISEVVMIALLLLLGLGESWVVQLLALLATCYFLSKRQGFDPGVAKSFVFFLQTTTLFLGHTWPAWIQRLSHAMSFVNLQFSSVACFAGDYFSDPSRGRTRWFLFQMATPFALMVAVAVLFLVRTGLQAIGEAVHRRRTRRQLRNRSRFSVDDSVRRLLLDPASDEDAHLGHHHHGHHPGQHDAHHHKHAPHLTLCRSLLFVAYLAYFELVVQILAVFPCTVEETGASFMTNARWIPCGSSQHLELVGWGVAFAVLIVIGFPCLFFLLIFLHRDTLTTHATETLIGFLYENARPGLHYFELFWIARRVAIAAATSLLCETAFQPVAVVAILVGSILVENAYLPHKSRALHAMELGALASLAWTYVSRTSFTGSGAHQVGGDALVQITFAINVLTALAYLALMLWPLFPHARFPGPSRIIFRLFGAGPTPATDFHAHSLSASSLHH